MSSLASNNIKSFNIKCIKINNLERTKNSDMFNYLLKLFQKVMVQNPSLYSHF